MGVTEALHIINTVSEHLRNIDTGGPRCARGVNAAAYVRCGDATFYTYDLLNVMDQGTSTLPV